MAYKTFTMTCADPNARASGPSIFTIKAEQVQMAGAVLPHHYNPQKTQLWAIGHEYGAICAVWADNLQDAFDKATDAGLLDCLRVSDETLAEAHAEGKADRFIHAGNAGEALHNDYTWACAVRLSPRADVDLMLAVYEAYGTDTDTLGDL